MKAVESGAGMLGNIMVIDNSATMRALVSIVLADFGYGVITAASGREALEKIKDVPVSLVITDLYMPEMDGSSFIREIRSRDRYRHIPIVMLTAELREASKQEGKEAGATVCLIKPFSWDELIGVIKKFV